MENNTDTEVATKKQDAVVKRTPQTVRETLEKMKDKMTMALPKHLTADRMIMMATTSVSRNPKLLECSQTSLIGAIMQASQLGLSLDGSLGEAYLIPYNTRNGMEAQFIPGYRGLVSLAYRTNTVAKFQARVVYEGDEFEYEFGLDEYLKHKPSGKKEGRLKYVYCVITFKDGVKMFDVMTRDEVQLIRNKSKGKSNPVWDTEEDEMSKKTIIRRISKSAPLSPEFQKAVALDEMHFELDKPQKNQYDTLVNEEGFAEVINDEVAGDLKETKAAEMAASDDARKGKANQAMAGIEDKIRKGV